MKKTLLLHFALFSTIFCSAQATLEHSYTSDALYYSGDTYSFSTQNGLHFYTYDSGSNSLKIYTEAHALYKNVTLPNNGVTVTSIVCLTDKLFNNDNLIEFITITFLNNNTYKMTLINENGVVLQEFGARNTAKIIKNSSGNYKLVTSGTNQQNLDVDVYALSGTLSTEQFNQLSKLGLLTYPNPADNILNISNSVDSGEAAKLEIFSMNGSKILEKNVIGNSEKTVSVDISDLSNGMYIYKINGKQNKFIKK